MHQRGCITILETGEEEKLRFSVDNVEFLPDKANFTLFGIKNDLQRTGFEVSLPRGGNTCLDPVRTLEDYITKTQSYRPVHGPVFLTLKAPYRAIEASSVAKILDEP